MRDKKQPGDTTKTAGEGRRSHREASPEGEGQRPTCAYKQGSAATVNALFAPVFDALAGVGAALRFNVPFYAVEAVEAVEAEIRRVISGVASRLIEEGWRPLGNLAQIADVFSGPLPASVRDSLSAENSAQKKPGDTSEHCREVEARLRSQRYAAMLERDEARRESARLEGQLAISHKELAERAAEARQIRELVSRIATDAERVRELADGVAWQMTPPLPDGALRSALRALRQQLELSGSSEHLLELLEHVEDAARESACAESVLCGKVHHR